MFCTRPTHWVDFLYDDDDNICFALDQHTELTFYKWSITETTHTVWYDDDYICFALDQHTELTFYKCYLTETTHTGIHIVPLHITETPSQPVFALTS
jgi:hypothetical protein